MNYRNDAQPERFGNGCAVPSARRWGKEMGTGDMLGNTILLVLLVLYGTWVIFENKKDWFDRPRRPTRYTSLVFACMGVLSSVLHVAGFAHNELFWWSTPALAFSSSLVLGIVNPGAGIGTTYRFMTIAGPASLWLAHTYFHILLLGQYGGCLLGFRLGEVIHHSLYGATNQGIPQHGDTPNTHSPSAQGVGGR